MLCFIYVRKMEYCNSEIDFERNVFKIGMIFVCGCNNDENKVKC